MTGAQRAVIVALAVALLGGFPGCKGGEERNACSPGGWQSCTGASGCSGTQQCLADGSGYGACECGQRDAGVQLDGPRDAPVTDAPVADAPGADAAGADGPRADAPRADASGHDGPAADAAGDDASIASCGSSPLADHLLLTEVKVAPTTGELVEIHNPTSVTIDLTNYYLYNATYPGGIAADGGVVPECRYYNIVSGTQCGADHSDFSLRFPAGATIAAGEYQVIALTGALNYCGLYYPSTTCVKPTYEIPPPTADDVDVPNMGGTWDAADASFTTYGFLTNASEDLVLFYWDGSSATVKDVDYVIWGTSTAVRTDKTGIGTYLPDVPIDQQQPLAGAPAVGQSYQRLCRNEHDEPKTGGNGITGHDETGEDLGSTWTFAAPTPFGPAAGAQ